MCYLRVSGWLTRSASAHRSARSYQQQQVWYDAMQCTDMRSHVVPDVVSRFPQTTTHWPTRPGCTPPARAVNKHPHPHASSCASITQSTFVDHSTPPQVPRYCISDTLAFKIFLVSVDIRLAGCSSILRGVSCVSSRPSPPPMSLPHGTLSFSQVPACRTVRDGCSSLRYSNSEKRFRMPAARLYTKSSFPGNVSIMVSNRQPSRRHLICAVRIEASSCSMPLSRAASHSEILQLFLSASMS